jgi:hypothetical protein
MTCIEVIGMIRGMKVALINIPKITLYLLSQASLTLTAFDVV